MPLAEAKKIARRAGGLRREVSRSGARAPHRRGRSLTRRRWTRRSSSAAARISTHTGQAGFFKIVGQELVAKGVRRLTAVTGRRRSRRCSGSRRWSTSSTGRFQCKPDEVPAADRSRCRTRSRSFSSNSRRGPPPTWPAPATSCWRRRRRSARSRSSSARCRPAPDEQIRNQVDRLKQKAGSRGRARRLDGRRQGRPARGGHGRSDGEGEGRQARQARWRRSSAAAAAAGRTWPRPAARIRRSSAMRWRRGVGSSARCWGDRCFHIARGLPGVSQRAVRIHESNDDWCVR